MNKKQFDKLPTSIHIKGNWLSKKIIVDGRILMPDDSRRVRNHTPDDFNWGVPGGSAAQLALAILMLYMNSSDAYNYHQLFRFHEVSAWEQGNLDITINLQGCIKKIMDQKGIFIE